MMEYYGMLQSMLISILKWLNVELSEIIWKKLVRVKNIELQKGSSMVNRFMDCISSKLLQFLYLGTSVFN